MAATTIAPTPTQPPPDVPSLPGLNPNLTSYLRRFGMWAAQQLAGKVPTNQTISSLIFMAPDNTVWKFYIDVGGVVRIVQMNPGSPPTPP